ncbi:MAG: metallophosphoesterase [Nitrospinae bacterium]|nr:metallophosphoesterase [Nitrospinota bacterium]
MFFLIAFSVYLGAHIYVGARLIGPLKTAHPRKFALWVILLLHTLLLPSMFVIRNNAWAWETPWIYNMVFIGAGFMTIVFPYTVVRDAGWVIARIAIKASERAGAEDNLKLDFNPDRRRFLIEVTNGLVAGAAAITTGAAYHKASRDPAFLQVTIPIKNLPSAFDGYKLAHITDVHLCPTLRGGYLKRIVERINPLHADMVMVTGDMVDGYVRELREDMSWLGRLNAPDGVYFVTGNHEYYWGALDWLGEINRMGVTTLVNEHRVISRGSSKMLLAGIPDHSAGKDIPGHLPDTDRAQHGAPPCDFKLMMAHQPRSASYVSAAGFQLMVCGHTHGGQFFPWNLVIPLFHPVPPGLSEYNGMPVYTSRGAAYWGPPLRLGAPSEITLLTLTAA